jgi:hypothetical protein
VDFGCNRIGDMDHPYISKNPMKSQITITTGILSRNLQKPEQLRKKAFGWHKKRDKQELHILFYKSTFGLDESIPTLDKRKMYNFLRDYG